MPDPSLSIIIVNWNGGEPLRLCLESLYRYEDMADVEVIVSDNASTDGSLTMVRERFPAVTIIENGQNLGFGAANNRAIKLARGEFVLMLNPDMEFVETGLAKMIAYMREHLEIAVAGCRVENPDGSFMRQCRRGYPDPLTALYKASGLIRLFPRDPRIGKYFYAGMPDDMTMEVDAVSGSFMLARRAALLAAGGFDERYFLYVEEVDLCLRLRRAGWKILYAPLMRIRHHGGKCMELVPRRNAFYHYHMTRSHLILYHMDGSLTPLVYWAIVARYLALSLLTGNPHTAGHLREFARIRTGETTGAMRTL